MKMEKALKIMEYQNKEIIRLKEENELLREALKEALE